MKRQQREHARLPVLLKKSPCLLFYLCLLLYSTSAASASLSCGILVTRNTCITRRNSKLNLLPKTNHHPTLYQNRRRTDRYRNKKYPIGNNIQTHTNTHTHNIYTPTCTILQIPRGGSTSNTRTEDNTGTGTKKGNSSKTKGSKGKKGTKRKDYTTANATATNTTATNTRQTTSKINQNANIFRLLAPISADDKSVSSTNLQVKALLKRRTISWRTVARLILVILTVVYIQQCRNTIGIPHRQAIWKILYQEGYFSSNSMPSEFLPTDMESFLAQQIANAANDLIPPILMPLSKPFLGAVLSILSFLVFTILLPHWFLQIQVWFDYKHKHTTSIAQQSAINSFSAITPNANAALVAVVHTGKNTFLANLRCTNTQAKMIHGMPPYYIEYNQRRYYYDPDQGPTCWEGGPNLNVSVANIIQSARNTKPKTLYKTTHVGLLNTPSKLLQAQERWYTYNQQMKVQIPTLAQALWQRLQSPLVCIQMIGKTLAVLEEGREAFLSLGSTILQHYQNARASILASRTLQQDIAGLATEFAKQSVWIYRQGQWKKMVATDLLPGDAFLLSSSSSASSSSEEEKNTATTKMTANAHHAVTIPVDALLLDGVCVTMESVLTGEAVPQTKLPVDSTSPAWNQTLEMTGTHRNSVLFAGTSLLHCAPPPSRSRSIHHSTSKSNSQNDSSPPPGVLCLALRTGAYSSKGELLQVLSSSQAKTGSSTISNPQFDKDALKLIFIMSTAAFLSCGSLFLGPPTTGKKVSSFRRAIQCTRIATACIPSDLPLYISTVVQLCAKILRDESDVVCSQPGELLTAARIDTVVFDKTGTLTADTQSLSKIVDLEETTSKRNDSRTTKKKAKTMRSRKKGKNKDLSLDLEKELVLAGCHSLVFIKTTTDQHGAEGELVGDPLEIAALEYGQWKYDPQGQCFCPQRATDRPDGIERLWQLIVFPFDPALRLSSAICLTCHKDGQYRLWKVVKGSPDKVKELLERNADFEKSHTYQKKVQSLESKGFRTIAMAVKELTDNDGAFAKAILVATRAWTVDEADTIERARSIPRSDIDRDDLIYKEGTSSTTSTAKKQDDGGGASASAFDFAGFACYTAGIRPSSKRIINELKRAKIATVMLTGDSIAAAIAVAAKVGIMDDSSVAVLEALPGTTDLVWRILSNSAPKKKMTNPTILEVTKTSSQKVLEKARRGELRIAITGAAFQALQSTPATDTAKILLESIGLFSVIARATPQVKENFVSFLQNIANREVLMCGDGVNDCAAMKEAELSVALLNGFGAEETGRKDTEDERRRNRYKANERKKKNPLADQQREEMLARFKKKIQQKANSKGEITAKDVINAVLEERQRSKKLKKGGVEAARIIASQDGENESEDIKPGEASLASPFSCLRQSIDGVEAVLRTGIATAACSISMEQKIALNCLLSCFNLSALFKDDFRYGKHMWTAEYLFYILVDNSSFSQSVKPRPRLPTRKRPSSQSLFDPPNIVSVAAQAIIHFLSVHAGVRLARDWEAGSEVAASAARTAQKSLIRPTEAEHPTKASMLLNILNAKRESGGHQDVASKKKKFTPNFETNVVFVLSLFQGILTTLLFHKGKPFYLSILESDRLCQFAGISVLFALACILETWPGMNAFLELRPYARKDQKISVLSIALLDALGCILVEVLCRYFFDPVLEVQQTALLFGYHPMDPKKSAGSNALTAAEEEEMTLSQQEKANVRFVLKFAAIGAVMLLFSLLAE